MHCFPVQARVSNRVRLADTEQHVEAAQAIIVRFVVVTRWQPRDALLKGGQAPFSISHARSPLAVVPAPPGGPAAHEQTLAGPVAGWSGLTFLDLLQRNEGWATWEDWFAVAGRPNGTPQRLGLDSYSYVLEAAASGRGIALGWRHCIARPVETGALVALGTGSSKSTAPSTACSPRRDATKPLARKCLACFDQSR